MLMMEGIMNRLLKKFEDMMVAVTFAEAGEYDEAMAIVSNIVEDTIEKIPHQAAETV